MVKFPDKTRHQVFLEPEGLDTHEVYVNGMSTSMPIDVQSAMVASVPGLDQAEMIRPGYAIEYDAVDPRELRHSLELKAIHGLFLAGQINGTSGYEEAGCQGLMAGLNAACLVGGSDPVVVSRTEGYTGILIDDLVTKGADEPYRMFTSRAEFRLHLRIDNADERLTEFGRKAGLVCDERWALYRKKVRQKERVKLLLEGSRVSPDMLPASDSAPSERPTLKIWLRRPEARIQGVSAWLEKELGEKPLASVLMTAEAEAKYEGYIAQQEKQIQRLKDAEGRHIPAGFVFHSIPGLSREICEKLERVRPVTLGQAARIPGVTPAAVAVLDVYLTLARRTA